ncbi:hypothetical protein [Actibacterium sp.]|uniref:hypothetical protein n=1 Tax=Actibacterium sp. TaxID=1872125 RepID=UPI003565124F
MPQKIGLGNMRGAPQLRGNTHFWPTVALLIRQAPVSVPIQAASTPPGSARTAPAMAPANRIFRPDRALTEHRR